MTLLQSWVDSIRLFKPKNFQLFCLVTLKSIGGASQLMIKYFWWLILLYLGATCGPLLFESDTLIIRSAVFAFFLYQLLFFMVCVATRPSLIKKDCAYFRSEFGSFFNYIFFVLGLIGIAFSFGIFLNPTSSGIATFLILFFLDSPKKLKDFFRSVWHALKMALYNCPLMIGMTAFMWIINWILYFPYSLILDTDSLRSLFVGSTVGIGFLLTIESLLRILFLIIFVCFYANIYIKRLHDQLDLYITEPQ